MSTTRNIQSTVGRHFKITTACVLQGYIHYFKAAYFGVINEGRLLFSASWLQNDGARGSSVGYYDVAEKQYRCSNS